MTLDSLPDLEYKRVVSCKDSFHGTDVLAVSEHGAPGRRPNIHTHCRPAPPRQTEALSSRTSRSRPWKRRSQAVRDCFTGLAGREFFTPEAQCNSDVFLLYMQRHEDADFVAIRTRRHEGHTWSAWPLDTDSDERANAR